MGFTYYSYLILLAPDTDATIEGLKSNLDSFYANDERTVKIDLNGNDLTVNIDGYNLYVHYSNESHVIEESEEIANDAAIGLKEFDVIKSCTSRFELHGDPDYDMDYFNDSLYLQEEMEKFKGVFIFDTMDGNFVNL